MTRAATAVYFIEYLWKAHRKTEKQTGKGDKTNIMQSRGKKKKRIV